MDEVEQEMDAPHFKDAVARYKSEAGKLTMATAATTQGYINAYNTST